MKIGIMGDIHGNIRALEVAVEYFKKEGCDTTVFMGDVIDIGPYPNECAGFLAAHPEIICICGNHDISHGSEYLLSLSDKKRAHQEWTRMQLGNAEIDFLMSMPDVVFMTVDGVRLAFEHYPVVDGALMSRKPDPDAARLDEAFSYLDADVIFFAHTHLAVDISGKKRYINCGPTGCPYNTGGASVGIAEIRKGSLLYSPAILPYDYSCVVSAIIEKRPPQYKKLIVDYYNVEYPVDSM